MTNGAAMSADTGSLIATSALDVEVASTASPIDIRLEGIWKRFGGTVALKGVDFCLRGGEVHVLLGENGAGKSTLVKVLSGVYQVDAGRIRIDGEEKIIESPIHSRALGIVTIFQEFSLFRELTVAENLHLPHLPRGLFWKVNHRRMVVNTRRVLESIGAELDPMAPVFSLTVAERQLVEIARSLMTNARLIIMDEPTAALSGSETERLFKTIKRLRKEGVGVLYISHRLEEVKEIADCITVVRDGKLAGEVDARNASIPEMVRMMVGREVNTAVRAKPAICTGKPALELTGVSLSPHFSDIDLTIREGETVGIAGLVGSGAVELAHAILGDPPPNAGTVRLGGTPVNLKSPRHCIRCGIGLISEDRANDGLVLGASIKENVSLVNLRSFLRWGVLQWKREKTYAKDVVESLRIVAASIDAEAELLSGGNQQKLVVAKWMQHPMKMLVVAEPTRGVDVGAREEVYGLLDKLKERGVGILLVSSDLQELVRCSDRVCVMRRGMIVGELHGDEISRHRLLEETLRNDSISSVD